MKKYKVMMCDKDQENWINVIPVQVRDNEHPSPKAIKVLCEMGYERQPEDIKILGIKRVV